MNRFKVGQRVQPSAYALEQKRLAALHKGDTRAQRWYAEAKARRGVVADVSMDGVKVAWEDGTVSDSLDYMVEAI